MRSFSFSENFTYVLNEWYLSLVEKYKHSAWYLQKKSWLVANSCLPITFFEKGS